MSCGHDERESKGTKVPGRLGGGRTEARVELSPRRWAMAMAFMVDDSKIKEGLETLVHHVRGDRLKHLEPVVKPGPRTNAQIVPRCSTNCPFHTVS